MVRVCYGPILLWSEFVMVRVCYGPRCHGVLSTTDYSSPTVHLSETSFGAEIDDLIYFVISFFFLVKILKEQPECKTTTV